MLLFCALTIAVAPAIAQDAKAKTILDASSKKMSSLKSMKAGFVLRMLGKNGNVTQTQKGTLLMKGDKYHISLSDQELISDGKTTWTYMKKANEVQVSNSDNSDNGLSPTKLFSNFYDKNYSYKYIGTRKVGGKTCDIIELQPTVGAKSKPFSKIELAIDANKQIVGGTVFDKSGNQIQYEVSGVTPNAAIPESSFTFDAKAHPGVEVVDLR
jgi:outer membrane lipoprotein-sorting protein